MSWKRNVRKHLPTAVGDFLSDLYGQWVINRWISQGSIVPAPNHFKQKYISAYQKKYQYQYFVETGTYQGDMIHAQRKLFPHIYSIELDEQYWLLAKKRFKSKSYINLLHGDSSTKLREIKTDEPAFFWLDAHYSGGATAMGDLECPIYDELSSINWDVAGHLILIDDARCFDGTNSYPTLKKLEEYFLQNCSSSHNMQVEHDIIVFEPEE